MLSPDNEEDTWHKNWQPGCLPLLPWPLVLRHWYDVSQEIAISPPFAPNCLQIYTPSENSFNFTPNIGKQRFKRVSDTKIFRRAET